MNQDCTCQGCTDRYVGCHGSCERYINWAAEHENERNRINKEKGKEADLDGYFISQRMSRKRIRRKGKK